MNGSRTVRVLKRDSTVENFDVRRLAGAMWRAMEYAGCSFRGVSVLASAVEIYLRRRSARRVKTSAIFEMTVKVLRRVRLVEAAEAMETYRNWRKLRRQRVRISHGDGKVSLCEKSWLRRLARQSWNLSPIAARIIAGEVEMELLRGRETLVPREVVVEMINARVAEFGLADAVPIQAWPAQTNTQE